MTHPTKAIYASLLKDFCKLAAARQAEDQIFNEEDLKNSLPRIDVVDFHQIVDINGIRVRTYNSCHFDTFCAFDTLLKKYHDIEF